jgi:hypothetical protein
VAHTGLLRHEAKKLPCSMKRRYQPSRPLCVKTPNSLTSTFANFKNNKNKIYLMQMAVDENL